MLAVALGASETADALVTVSTSVSTDTVWGDDPGEDEILLQNPIFVNGGAVLTILPGVIVRGQPRSAAVQPLVIAGSPGTLVVTRSGTLVAEGSATSPIIMTTGAVDNDADGVCDDLDGNGFEDAYPGFDPAALPALNPDASPTFCDATPTTAPMAPLNAAGGANVALWGGLVLLGSAPTNLDDFFVANGTAYGEGIVEGLTVPGFPVADATYGGVDTHDSSGSVRYVSVRHAGDEIGGSNELNGVTLAGVGDGTVFEYVEVYANFDDGIEWFGGTVNGNHLVVAFAGDDQFDMDQGYTGVNQFVLAVMPFFNEDGGSAFGSASGDKLCELDGDDYNESGLRVNVRSNVELTADDPAPWPLADAGLWNATMIGATQVASPDFTAVSGNGNKTGCQMRNGFGGELANSVIVNTGGSCIAISGGGAPGYSTTDNVANDLVRVTTITCQDGTAPAGSAATAIANGDAYAALVGAGSTVINPSPASFGLVNDDVSFDTSGNAANVLVSSLKSAPFDPRTTGTVGVDDGLQPQDGGLDRAATYRGAFESTAPELWTTGWTVLNISGLMAD